MIQISLKVVPVILAAGHSSRMGSPKPFIRVKGKTFLEKIAEKLKNSGVAFPGFVVYNPDHLSQLNTLQLPDFELIPNDRIEWGPLYSVQSALSRIPSDVSAFLLCLVDHPFVDEDTYRDMIRNHRRFPEHILISIYKGKRGHPALFPVSLFQEILRLSPNLEGGLRSFIKDYPNRVLEFPTNDPGVLADIDRPQDLASYLEE